MPHPPLCILCGRAPRCVEAHEDFRFTVTPHQSRPWFLWALLALQVWGYRALTCVGFAALSFAPACGEAR